MKIIHTSDWHLGKKLYGRNRYEESERFLNWLIDIIEKESADALLISGDIFDTVSPPNKALEQYYGFLYRVSATCCENIIITAGNHDSPSLLNAPKELLKAFNIHVIGNAADDPDNEAIIINGKDKTHGAVVCAVPYLREKDIRTVNEEESCDDKSRRMLEGIKEHYSCVMSCAEAKSRITQHNGLKKLPIVVMGHLFTAGGTTVSGDGVREIYVGNLEKTGCDIFPENIDYLALGHLHVPQKVFGCENKRYCGSPIPIGFSEAKQRKMVIAVEFLNGKTAIKEIYVPSFRELRTISGSIDEIRDQILELNFSGIKAPDMLRIWAEVIYTGKTAAGDLREIILEMTNNSSVEILRIKNESLADGILRSSFEGESLDSLSEYDVFERCLDSSGVEEKQWPELKETFSEALVLLHEEDFFKE
jgi:exonuclease SbcD